MRFRGLSEVEKEVEFGPVVLRSPRTGVEFRCRPHEGGLLYTMHAQWWSGPVIMWRHFYTFLRRLVSNE